jgi:hypothetical protein
VRDDPGGFVSPLAIRNIGLWGSFLARALKEVWLKQST